MNCHSTITVLLAFLLTGVLGCSGDSNTSTHDDHDHAKGETHSEDDGHDHSDHDGHDHGDEERSLGTVTIGGTSLEVTVGGEPHPKETLHVDLVHTAGPMPSSIRVWFGEQSGVGSLKGKGEGSNGSYHADAEIPDKVSSSMRLWIEVEKDGKRSSGSVALD